MKYENVQKVGLLADRLADLQTKQDWLEVSLGVTISDVCQQDDMLREIRPVVREFLQRDIDRIKESMRALGVEFDE